MHCYLCNSTSHEVRPGRPRDNADIEVLECKDCGLVFLGSSTMISDEDYQKSKMHEGFDTEAGGEAAIATWLRETDWDDARRIEMLGQAIVNKTVLDFGCGAGGFLLKAQNIAAKVVGIELEQRVLDHFAGQLELYSSIEECKSQGLNFDVITAFHVLEHVPDPRAMLKELAEILKPGGKIIIELPSGNDALLSLYENKAFQNFTYWSAHLYLFTPDTCAALIRQAGLKAVSIQPYQRYPLSNHLYWLSNEKSGGHEIWSFLDTPELTAAYQNSLARMNRADTVIAYIEKP